MQRMSLPGPTLDALVQAAHAAERQGLHAEACIRYEEALRAVRTPAEAARVPALLRWVGSCHRALGDRSAALDCYRASLCVARRLRHRHDVAHALNWIGIVHQDHGRLDAADQWFRKARRHARRVRDTRLLAMLEQNLGINCNIRGDLRSALQHYRISLACYERLGETRLVAQGLNVLGMLYTDLGRWGAAAQALHRSARLCAEGGDPDTLVMVEVNRAELFATRHQYRRARRSCDRAFGLATRLGLKPALGETWRWYGAIAREQGDLREAERCLALAVDTARAYAVPLLEAESLREMALLFRAQARNREALHALLQSRAIFNELHARRDLAELGRRLADLEAQFLAIVRAWAESIESKDRYTHGHCSRVAEYSTTLARHLGFDDDTLQWFRMGAYLHDVGKTVVPDHILNKPAPLTPAEADIIRSHTTAGEAIVAGLGFPWDIAPIVRSHHERWDGAGYPDGLRGAAIPLGARILCVADVFDALTSARPYRSALSIDQALAMMERSAGAQLDPHVFHVFRGLVRQRAFARVLAA
jgi:putative nucleotidyltransferase with HDIG domain